MRGGAKRRKAIYRNLVSVLIEHGKVATVEPQAKMLQAKIDRLVNFAKKNDLSGRRLVANYLLNKKLVNKLVDEIVPKLDGRTSGFTRITKIGRRLGDRAMLAKVEFVEFLVPTPQEASAEVVMEEKIKEEKPRAAKKVREVKSKK